MSFLTDILYSSSIAMEAEDITGQVESGSSEVAGNEENDGEISLNTDDILGTQEPDNPTDNNTEETGDNPDNNLENPDDSSGDDMNFGDDSSSTNGLDAPPEEDPLTNKDDEFETTRKKKLWKQFRYLYDIITEAIELVTEYIPNLSDSTTIKVLDDLKENLINAKEKAFDTMTSEYNRLSYPQMEKRYRAINMIYDIVTNELEKYFELKKKSGK